MGLEGRLRYLWTSDLGYLGLRRLRALRTCGYSALEVALRQYDQSIIRYQQHCILQEFPKSFEYWELSKAACMTVSSPGPLSPTHRLPFIRYLTREAVAGIPLGLDDPCDHISVILTMWFSRALLVICSFLSQLTFTHPSPPTKYEIPTRSEGIQIKHIINVSSSQSQRHGHPQPPFDFSIGKRDDNEEDYLRVRQITIFTSTVPIISATHHLDFFYNTILYNALTTWAEMPAQPILCFSLGCLRLTISVVCNPGPPRGIPWAFVRNLARNMIVMTRAGFAGTYMMHYWPVNGMVGGFFVPAFCVEVRLEVRWEGIRQRLPP